MKLARVKIRNFRCYTDEVSFELGDLTSLIGKNDAGKSSILEALSIFFEEQKPDSDDAAKHGDRADMTITCEFADLPSSLILDATSRTTLAREQLLNSDCRLEIVRVFNGSLKTPTAKTFIRAMHPSAEGVNDLLKLKITELRTRLTTLGVPTQGVNQSVSAEIREAIRAHVEDLELTEQLIEVEQVGAKEIYTRIKEALPAFFLFKSDRSSTDQDGEAQDPMKAAVKIALEQERETLDKIALSVTAEVRELIKQTVARVADMAPEVARELLPTISEPKWDSVFKIALTGDTEIPLNKRGSGVRRLVLLGFLQAQAESRRLQTPDRGIIYAIEEPETSQHPDMQRALLDAMREIAEQDGYQVLVTTHTPMLGRLLPASSLHYIESAGEARTIHPPGEETLKKVAKALGVLPDHGVKVFVGVEGKHDENFLRAISATLSETEADIPNLAKLEDEGTVVFIPVGGSSAGLWVSKLEGLGIPEFHLFDRDFAPPQAPHYDAVAQAINSRSDAEAVHTGKAELENYLHPAAIQLERTDVQLGAVGDFENIPARVAQIIHDATSPETAWMDLEPEKQKKKESNTKHWLNKGAVAHMTADMLSERDPDDDLRTWLRRINSHVTR
ncbi:ATP-binding protein [uncultured Schumannella sp.]|uniref:ATP-binding protein n=1 Tax=uncultured Schumannella sp. TaxID=1195956 RepID=UPI0025FAB38B|nr:ATP-binding protein [uncultured Schumannella sp.]